MIVTLAFHSGDADQAMRLLAWMQQLGGCPNYQCVLVVDAGVPWGDALDAVSLAGKVFKSAQVITNDEPTEGWIPGSNSLFKAAAMHAQKLGEPWLFIEPDAVPTKADWLRLIDVQYQEAGCVFMGAVIHHQSVGLPNPYLEGCAVYPANAWEIMEPSFRPEVSWTLACRDAVIKSAFNSPLFQHFWGPKPELAPTFSEVRTPDSPENTLLLSHIKAETALYHRNKDGTLIRLLKKNSSPGCPPMKSRPASSSLAGLAT